MDFDIAIVGGGMVGASLAVALADAGLDVILIEAHAPDDAVQPSFDERTTALGNGSRRIFEALGLWPRMAAEAAAIRRIHVSDAGRFGFARVEAAALGLDALGYVVANRVIGAALWSAIAARPRISTRVPAKVVALQAGPDTAKLTLQSGTAAAETVRARLVVAADGAASLVRAASGIDAAVKDYAQSALVLPLQTDRDSDGTAFERFTPSGPLAVLPVHAPPGAKATGSYTCIWALAPAVAQELAAADPRSLLARLQRAFGWRIGALRAVGRRGVYPLALSRAVRLAGERVILIGNAAQALHPVAGQGFNLGLRDAAQLAEVLSSPAARPDVGAAAVLADFAQRRERDRQGVVRFTDGLVSLFGDSRPGVAPLRDLGLLLFDLNPAAKRALARVSWGFGERSPRLVRGLGLP